MTPPNQRKELKLIKTLWGIDEPISPHLFHSIKQEGYHGVEVIRLPWLFERDLLVNCLNEAELAVVCQVHTAGGYLHKDSGEYIYCGAYDVAAHKQDFQKQLRECKEVIHLVNAGGFINVHAGVDAWSNEEALQFLNFCLKEIEQITPEITVTFETHRQRLFGSPFQTRDLLSSLSQSKLKLNADLSHWYCACERVFNSEDERDKWWPRLLSSVSGRCEYIHARFGWAQGPQMADPSTAEFEPDRRLQIKVWKILMEEQKNKSAFTCNDTGGMNIFVSPEYGPAPYMTVMPHTQEPVASLPEAVSYTKKVIEELFESI
jgi:sugar phosphate isomerase/epimerase